MEVKNNVENVEKGYKYDFSIKTRGDRAEFMKNKLGFILDCPPYMLMGYQTESRKGEGKTNRIPNLIDTYTAYFLRANDAGSSRKTEYSFYIDKHEEILRASSKLFINAESMEGSQKKEWDDSPNHIDTYTTDGVFEPESIDVEVLVYAIENGHLKESDCKRILSSSLDILYETEDLSLVKAIEQVVFNCHIHCKDDVDREILEEYMQGRTVREIADIVNVGKSTVNRRIDNMLTWVSGTE